MADHIEKNGRQERSKEGSSQPSTKWYFQNNTEDVITAGFLHV